MSILRKARERAKQEGVGSLLRSAPPFVLGKAYRAPSTALNNVVTVGTNVFDLEWDLLILLDTCRVDALTQLRDELAFVDAVGSIRLTGGSSPEWIARTFDRAHLQQICETLQLSANPYTEQILDRDAPAERLSQETHLTYDLLSRMPTVSVDDLAHCEYIFNYEPRGERGPNGIESGATPPRYVTERTIDVMRSTDAERVIAHYWQPHYPNMANAIAEERDLKLYEGMVGEWSHYIRSTGDTDAVWNAYLDELRWVLEEVELVLENVDAERVAISSDHGESFGRFGVFGHKIGSFHPDIRPVPWVTTTAKDERTLEPTVEIPAGSSSVSDVSVEENLRSLGYID